MAQQFKSTWHKMRELVILSLNIIYIKDTLQSLERLTAKLQYINMTDGPLKVTHDDLQRRKHELNKRMKRLLEELMNSSRDDSEFCFNVELEHASFTKKQLEKGYVIFNNIRDVAFALDIRKGSLLPIANPESNVLDPNLASLQYTERHDGPVYKYFEIDTSDPLKNSDLRY